MRRKIRMFRCVSLIRRSRIRSECARSVVGGSEFRRACNLRLPAYWISRWKTSAIWKFARLSRTKLPPITTCA